MHEVQNWLVRSKLSTWLSACQLVYYSLMPAFYNTLGFILHRHWMGTSWVQEQHQHNLLLNSQVAGSCVYGRSCSRWNYRPRPLSWQLFFQRMLVGSFSLSRVCQCGHNCYKTVTHSWINVLICIPCAWPAAIITFLCGTGSWPECPDVVFSPSRSSHWK